MMVLHIHVNADGSLTAIEREYNDEAKYVETFPTWEHLFATLLPYLGYGPFAYYWVEVHTS